VIEGSLTDGRPAWDAVPNTLLVPYEDDTPPDPRYLFAALSLILSPPLLPVP
jgi:hypothetical protein